MAYLHRLTPLLVTALCAALCAAGCSVPAAAQDAQRESAPTTSASGAPEGPTQAQREDAFLRSLEASGNFADVSDETSLEAGRQVCAALERGEAASSVLASARAATPGLAGSQIVGSAVGSLCPQFTEQILDAITR